VAMRHRTCDQEAGEIHVTGRQWRAPLGRFHAGRYEEEIPTEATSERSFNGKTTKTIFSVQGSREK
jgi:hypothetical protein